MLPAEPVTGHGDVNMLNLSKVGCLLTADTVQTSQIRKLLEHCFR